MADEIIKSTYQIDIDQARLRNVLTGVRSFRQTINETVQSVKSSDVTLRQAGQSIDAYGQRVRDVQDRLDRAGRTVDVYKNELKELRAELESQVTAEEKVARARQRSASTAGESASGGSANDRFDEVSRRVALAGDVQSNLGALRGLTGLAGAGGLSGAIGGLGEVVALAEELPRLKAAAAGLPDVLKSAASTIGASGAGLIGAVGALTVALALAQAQSERTRQAALADLDARQRAFQLIASGDKEAVQERINQLAQEREANQRAADEANKLLSDFRAGIRDSLGDAGLAFAELGAATGIGAGELTAAKEAADKANSALNESSVELGLLQQASGLTAQSIEELTFAENQLRLERLRTNEIVRSSQNKLSAELEKLALVESGTTESLSKRLQSLQQERELINIAIQDLSRKRDLEIAGSEAQKALNDEILNLADRADVLSDSIKVLGDSTLEASIKAREAAEYAAKQQVELAAAAKSYNDDVKKITDAGYQAQADSARRYSDALVKAAQQAAEAAENALNRLQEKRSELANKLAEGEADAALKAQQQALDDQISFQRDEARAAREHARTLVQIRRDANRDEQRLIDERDFRGLFELRSRTNDSLKAESERFQQEREEANIAYAEQAEDRAAAFAREREERLLNYRRALIEAQAQYTREIQQAAQNRQKQIQLAAQANQAEVTQLQNKLQAELRLRLQAYDAELRLVSQSASQRIAIEQATQNALASQAQARLNSNRLTGSGSGSLVGNQTINGLPASFAFRSGGGGLNAGQASTYNERAGQRERFAGHLLPEGAGVIFPFRAGYMNPGGTSKPMTFNAPLVSLNVTTGGSAAQMSSLSDMVADKVLDVLEVINGNGGQ